MMRKLGQRMLAVFIVIGRFCAIHSQNPSPAAFFASRLTFGHHPRDGHGWDDA